MSNNGKIALLVVSYDGYSDLWDSFFMCLEKNWSEHSKYKIYLVTNELEPTYNNINIIKTGKEKSWSEKVAIALSQISEETIVFFLEDYFIGDVVNNSKIEEYIHAFIINKYDYLRLVTIPKLRGVNDLIEIKENDRYGVNLQLAIWRRRILQEIVTQGNFSAWEFEKRFNDGLIKINKGKYYAVSKDCLNIQNGVIKGKWYPKTISFFGKKAIDIKMKSDREVMTKKEYRKYQFKSLMSAVLPNWLIKVIKPILKKLGFKFTT